MSTRVHTTSAAHLAVEMATTERLVELFGDDFADVTGPVLVIEDAGNMEAWVVSLSEGVGPLSTLASLLPTEPSVEAVVSEDDDGAPMLVCPKCGESTFGYREGCEDYREPGGQRYHADGEYGEVSVVWSIGGTGETGDSNPGLFCDDYRGDGCGVAIDLPAGWLLSYD